MPHVHRFGPFELRTTERVLLRDGKPRAVGGRALDLLIALVQAGGERVDKAELLQRVWAGLVVEEANLHVQVSQLRKLLGADAIGTVAGLGYRFTLPLDREPPRHNLPAATTSFVGREAALTDAQARLERTRLLTLIGIGGTGKTRLALQLARRQLAAPFDRVGWADLAALESADQLAPTVAQSVGCVLTGGTAVLEQLAAHLEGRRCLLLLDNCEALLDAVASMVDLLLAAAPGLQVLATSREALDLPGETVLPVRPLELPPPGATRAELAQTDAVALFVQRAAACCPGWSLADDNAIAVAEICRRLDGIPLALELAAAQLRVVAPGQLLALLSERFRLLVGSRRALPRQQTLAAVIRWSHDRLRPAEQRVLGCLAVCAGGCELDAVAALAGPEQSQAEWLSALARLADQSLLDVRQASSANRYVLLETVRQFALERLHDDGSIAELRERHARHYLGLAEGAFADIEARGRGETALARLDRERDNLLRALDWWERSPEPAALQAALRLLAALRYYWPSRGLLALGVKRTRPIVERAFVLPHERHHSYAMAGLAQMLSTLGEHDAAQAVARRLLERAAVAGDDTDRLVADLLGGELECSAGRVHEARAHFDSALRRARETGATRHQIGALSGLARVAAWAGDGDEAARLADQVLVLRRQDGHGYNLVVALLNVASAALDRDDHPRAAGLLAEALAMAPDIGSAFIAAHLLAQAARVLVQRQHWPAAVELQAAARALAQGQGLAIDAVEQQRQAADLERARAAIGAQAFDGAWSEGLTRGAGAALRRAAELLAEAPGG